MYPRAENGGDLIRTFVLNVKLTVVLQASDRCQASPCQDA